MRKLLVALLTICLLLLWIVSAPVTFAEEIDLTSMSLDELACLRKSIEDEITQRLSDGNTLIYPSIYVVGKDIKAGSYIFTGLSDDPFCNVEWYASEADYDAWESIENILLYDGTIYKVTLEEGMVLEIEFTFCRIQEAPPMLFAP